VQRELEVTAEKIVPQGFALAHAEGKTLFIRGAIPGEKVRVLLTHRKKGVFFGRVLEVISPSPERIAPPCGVFPLCGGCTFLHLPYSQEIRYKKEILKELFSHRAPEILAVSSDPVAMDSWTFYRNKMEFSFGLIQGEPVVGLHRIESHLLIVPAVNCLLMSPESQKILEEVQSFVREEKIPVHLEGKDQQGLRYLVIREGKNTGERLLHLVVSSTPPEIYRLVESLTPPITTVLLSTHRGITPAVMSEEISILSGRGYIYERLGRYHFRIGPYTFFQANTRGAEILFDTLRLWAEELGADLIFDLYTGSAPIAIYLHRAGRKILAVESNPEAIISARENLTMNGIEGVELIQAEVEGFLASTDLKPDLVIVDPPRTGLHPRALKGLLRLKPRDLFYVSCNPATFLRDYEILREHGYTPQKGIPIDLFPRTYHLEFLCHLRLDSHR